MDDFRIILLLFFVSISNANAMDIIRQNETAVQTDDTDAAPQYLVLPPINNTAIFFIDNADGRTKITNPAVNDKTKTYKTVHKNVKVTIRKHSKANQSKDGRDNDTSVSYASWSNLDDSNVNGGGNKVVRYDLTGVTTQGSKERNGNIKHGVLSSSSKSDEIKEYSDVTQGRELIYPVYDNFYRDATFPEFDKIPVPLSDSSKVVQSNHIQIDGHQIGSAVQNKITDSELNVVNNEFMEKNFITKEDGSNDRSTEHGLRSSVSQTLKTRDETDATKITNNNNTVSTEDHTNDFNTDGKILLPGYNISKEHGSTVTQDKTHDNKITSDTVSVEHQRDNFNKSLSETASGNSSRVNHNISSADIVTPSTIKNKTSVEIGKPDNGKVHTCVRCVAPKTEDRAFADIVCNKSDENLKSFWLVHDKYVYTNHGKDIDLYRYGKLSKLLNIFTKLNEVRQTGADIDMMITNLIEILDHPQLDVKIETKQHNAKYKTNKFIESTNTVVAIERDLQDDNIHVRKYETKLGEMSFPKKDEPKRYDVEEFIKNYILWPNTKPNGKKTTENKRVSKVKKPQEKISKIYDISNENNVPRKQKYVTVKAKSKDNIIDSVIKPRNEPVRNYNKISMNNDNLPIWENKRDGALNSQVFDKHDIISQFPVYNINALGVTPKNSIVNSYKYDRRPVLRKKSSMFDDNVNENPLTNINNDEVDDVTDIELTTEKEPLNLNKLVSETQNIVKQEKNPMNVLEPDSTVKNNVRIQQNIFPDYELNNFSNTPKEKLDKDETKPFIMEPEHTHNEIVNPIKYLEQDLMNRSPENKVVNDNKYLVDYLSLEGLYSTTPKEASSDTSVQGEEILNYQALYQKLLQMKQETDGLDPDISNEKRSEVFIPHKKDEFHMNSDNFLKESTSNNPQIKYSYPFVVFDPDITQSTNLSPNQNAMSLWSLLKPDNDNELTKPGPNILRTGDSEATTLSKMQYSNSPYENNWINNLMLQNPSIDWSALFNSNENNVPSLFNEDKPEPETDVYADLLKLLGIQHGKYYMDGYNNPFTFEMDKDDYIDIPTYYFGRNVPVTISQKGNYKTADNVKLDGPCKSKESGKQFLKFFDSIYTHLNQKGMKDEAIGDIISNFNDRFLATENEK